MKFGWRAGMICRFIVFGLLLFSSIGCSSVLYQPTHFQHYPPSQLKLEPESLWVKSQDNHLLYGWYFHAKDTLKPKAVVVFFHGNGENLSSHYLSLIWLLSNGYDFFIFDYQGYGRSEGKPSPEGTIIDGKAVLREIHKKKPDLPLVVLGQSLGGAVAMRTVIELKDEVPVKLVVIDSSFASYRAAGRSILSKHFLTWIFQPLTCLVLSDSAAPLERVKEISPTPLVVIHGEQDQSIDVSLGEEIYQLAGEPKEFWKIPNGKHIDSFWRKDPNLRLRLLQKLDSLFCLSPCKPEPLQDKRGLR